MSNEIATFGAGCFWCLESALNQLNGVKQAISGYMGGHTVNPDYRSICTGTTGHAEVVQVQFNPEQISFKQLCQVFFALHDPTQLNRQGNDVGTQYRSVVFFHSEQQAETARNIINELTTEQLFDQPIVTELSPAGTFYPAEDYHQGYFLQNPEQGYCQFIIAPKMAKFRQLFSSLMK
ncbi:peptide-methionine (S)-S-oxide reductase [Arsukibacterium tuosuense]|uniref:Peptide methionine sulfoxide reductase MsrA n=1 Tax=Arsukibacterium tuosuense TaxID=1323745 RepID=A0A285IF56_9GAMM|nr:peptide-methionine (S)-S-oxide reductase MsrA [Arsukibacterium tuosuense]SNY46417.1 peptide-methionine (S)-S-oxide reductase [Arsukibacterium tuosuense]